MEQIKELMTKSLSNSDIMKLINNKANLISYTNIHKYKTLDELLGKYGACIILYETKKLYGHWCCIFKLDDNMIEFFDPYGLYPDKQLKMINNKYREISNQNFPYLTKLMIESPYILSYNHNRFQEFSKLVNSCGRWVSLRLLFRHLSLDAFIKLFDKKGREHKPDFYATVLTNFV